MRKTLHYLICLCLCLSLVIGNSTVAYANENLGEIDGKKIIKIDNNKEIQEINYKLENSKVITQNDLSQMKENTDISIKKIDSEHMELIIKNKIPDKICYLEDGTKIENYTTTLLACKLKKNNEETNSNQTPSTILTGIEDGTKIDNHTTSLLAYKLKKNYEGTNSNQTPSMVLTGSKDDDFADFYVQIYIKMAYNQYQKAGNTYTKLNTGYGKLVSCYERTYRNLTIQPAVGGVYDDPDGSRGISSRTTYTSTVVSPNMGTLYSRDTNNPHYYATSTGNGWVQVNVSIEWSHNGSTFYTSSFTLDY
ncbi:MAG: hypothetical protein ABFD18_03530 [Syntrophomonas sp.]